MLAYEGPSLNDLPRCGQTCWGLDITSSSPQTNKVIWLYTFRFHPGICVAFFEAIFYWPSQGQWREVVEAGHIPGSEYADFLGEAGRHESALPEGKEYGPIGVHVVRSEDRYQTARSVVFADLRAPAHRAFLAFLTRTLPGRLYHSLKVAYRQKRTA